MYYEKYLYVFFATCYFLWMAVAEAQGVCLCPTSVATSKKFVKVINDFDNFQIYQCLILSFYYFLSSAHLNFQKC